MGLFSVIWCQMGVTVAKGSLWVSGAQQGISADQKGSVWLIRGQWDSVGFSRNLWRPVEFIGGQWDSFGSLWARRGAGGHPVSVDLSESQCGSLGSSWAR